MTMQGTFVEAEGDVRDLVSLGLAHCTGSSREVDLQGRLLAQKLSGIRIRVLKCEQDY